MTVRKDPLISNAVYHIINRSIAKYTIFNNDLDFSNYISRLKYYQNPIPSIRYSLLHAYSEYFLSQNIVNTSQNRYVDIIAYCVMPTHFHLILRQNIDNGISKFISDMLNSYTKYFNVRYKRKGPLWEGRFKNIPVKTDDQLLHLTRYIHLNPTSANLVKKPEDWEYSSYREYIGKVEKEKQICKFDDVLDIDSHDYKKFCEDRISYQKEISKIKQILLENYTG